MESRAVASVAGIIDRLEDRPCRPGRPPLPTIEVVETLHLFVREGAQWRQLRAAAGRASGSTLPRRLDGRGATALLRQVHVALIRPVRAGPEVAAWDVVVDSCPVAPSGAASRPAPIPPTAASAGPGPPSGPRPPACRSVSSPRPPTSMTRGSSRTCRAWPEPSA